jgi:hypothetical protein
MIEATGPVRTTNAQETIVVNTAAKISFQLFPNVFGKWAKLALALIDKCRQSSARV